MPTETRDRDPYWGRMFMSSAELEALKEEAAEKVRNAYDATTRAIAGGLHRLAGERDAPVDKLKVGMEAEMRRANAAAAGSTVRPATPKPVQPLRDPARDLMELIAQAEVKGHPVSYDVTYGFGKYDPSGFDKPITQMTLDEVDRFQAGMRAPRGSTPVGKYQFTRDTLRDLRRNLRLNGSEVFTPELQERLGRKRLEIAGYDRYLAGELGEQQFRTRLNKAWASVPLPGDVSEHDQPLGTTDAEVTAVLRRAARTGR